jgi:hypothetical protein
MCDRSQEHKVVSVVLLSSVPVPTDFGHDPQYKDLLNSSTILESSLHENLTERTSDRHRSMGRTDNRPPETDINSEIGLRTIRSIETAQQWIKTYVDLTGEILVADTYTLSCRTFLYIRIQRNPRFYSKLLSQNATGHTNWQKALEEFIAVSRVGRLCRTLYANIAPLRRDRLSS